MTSLGHGTGPLKGIKVVELAGIGPGPQACMHLADLGADVIRVERPGGAASAGNRSYDLLTRGRPSVALDMKNPAAVQALLELVEGADVFVEGLRPGAAERLGVGPDELLARNPRLVYGRMTGWGQTGPLAQVAGHDMNYIALAGALHSLGQDKSRPHFPSNLVGDFGGGSTYLVIGILAALLESKVSGRGQVVDAAIVDGAAHLQTMSVSMVLGGNTDETKRAASLLDGGVPFYDVYETSDGRHMSVGCLEPQFYAEFIRLFELEDAPDRYDFARMDELRGLFAERFKTRTMAEWAEVFAGSDACVAEILTITEAARHPHIASREVYVERDGLLQPSPAPRFSRTEATLTTGPSVAGGDTIATLQAWGIKNVDELIASGAAVQAQEGDAVNKLV